MEVITMNNEVKKSRRGSIRAKLLITVLPVVLVAFMVVITVLVNNARGIIRERSNELIMDQSEKYNHEIQAVIDELMAILNVFHGSLEQLNGTDEEMLEYLAYTMVVDERLPYGIYAADKNNTYLDASGWVPDADYIPSERDWYTFGVDKNVLTLGEAYVDSQSGELCVSASCKLACRGSDNMVISSDIMLAEISAAVAEYKILENGRSYLVSISGSGASILAHANAELLGSEATTASKDAIVAAGAALYKNADGSLQQTKVNGETYYYTLTKVKGTDWVLVSYVPDSDISAIVSKMTSVATVAAIIAMGLVAAAIIVVIGSAMKPLQALTKNIDSMSHGDFTVDIATNGNDEIAMMCAQLAGFAANMRQIIGDITGVSQTLAGQADNSSNVSGVLYRSAESQSQAMRELNDTVEELSVSIGEIASNATSLAMIVNEAGERGVQANDKMQQTVAVTKEGRADMEKIKFAMEEIAVSVKQLEETVTRVGESTSEISKFVETIGNIASQTNLLSLNASIEAARAGEAGRGFAVVADEIRQLADTSTEAVTEITAITNGINRLVTDTIERTKESVEGIRQSVVLVDGACETFEEIFANIDATSDLVSTMVENVRTVDEVATSVAAITEEQSASTEEILATAESLSNLANNVSDNSQTVAGEAESIANTADLLSEHMKRFKVDNQ